MAASWIKVEVITPDKPEIYLISERLNIDPDMVLGKLIRLWVWADQQIAISNANDVTDSELKENGCNAPVLNKIAIDRIAFMPGFADALIYAGWLKQDGDSLYFNNFEKHNGKNSKKRALTNDRVSKSRDLKRAGNTKSNAKRNAGNVTQPDQKTLPEEEEEEDIKRERDHSARDQPVDNSGADNPERFRMHPDWKPLPSFAKRAVEWGHNLDQLTPYTAPQLRQFCDYWMPEDTLRFQEQWEMTFAKSLEHQAIKKFNET